MKTTIKYNGITKEIPNRLFDPIKETKNAPRKSYKFDALSLYYDGKYYFPEDIKPSQKREDYKFEIQVVYYSYKWYQDTHYITTEFKDFLLRHI